MTRNNLQGSPLALFLGQVLVEAPFSARISWVLWSWVPALTSQVGPLWVQMLFFGLNVVVAVVDLRLQLRWIETFVCPHPDSVVGK